MSNWKLTGIKLDRDNFNDPFGDCIKFVENKYLQERYTDAVKRYNEHNGSDINCRMYWKRTAQIEIRYLERHKIEYLVKSNFKLT